MSGSVLVCPNRGKPYPRIDGAVKARPGKKTRGAEGAREFAKMMATGLRLTASRKNYPRRRSSARRRCRIASPIVPVGAGLDPAFPTIIPISRAVIVPPAKRPNSESCRPHAAPKTPRPTSAKTKPIRPRISPASVAGKSRAQAERCHAEELENHDRNFENTI